MHDTSFSGSRQILAEPTDPRDRILAAIDVGTNSIHMVIVRIDPRLPSFTIISREKATVRLGEYCDQTGALTDKAMQRAFEALERCLSLAKSFQAEAIVAVATSAVREAPNGMEFLQAIDRKLGLTVDLISGLEEARRIYLGVLSATNFNHLPHVMIDIGGGSTELILGDGREPQFLRSVKVGAVRLTQQFIHSDPPTAEELERMRHYIRTLLERPIQEIRQLLGSQPVRLIGTSGTIETLAALDARRRFAIPPVVMQGYELNRSVVEEVLHSTMRMNRAERLQLDGLPERRAEIIVAGSMILQEAMSLLDAQQVRICERALREGLIVDWMLTHGLIEDRLRYQGSVRRRHLLKLAHKYQLDLPSAERIKEFALSLFDQMQGILHFWGTTERELLAAAALLHNCGHFVSHSSHHKHSYYLIRNDELLGYTEEEIEVIANIARYHRKSPPKRKHPNFQALLNDRYRQIVLELSAILRLAIALDRRRIGAIQQVRCDIDLAHHWIRFNLNPTENGDPCLAELWSLEFNQEIFAKQFGVQVESRLESPTAVPVLSKPA